MKKICKNIMLIGAGLITGMVIGYAIGADDCRTCKRVEEGLREDDIDEIFVEDLDV